MHFNEPHKNITFQCPESLRDKAKIQCVKQKTTLREVLTKLLIKWVAEQERREGNEIN